MLSVSPLIKDGALSLDANGQMVLAPDIITQCTVTIAAYNCMYNPAVNSGLIPYLKGIPFGGRTDQAVVNIVKAAFQVLIVQNLVVNLSIGVVQATANSITIKVNLTDPQQNPVSLSWRDL